MNYKQKLLDPRWQRKRLEILQRDDFRCAWCGNDTDTLHIHHLSYAANPWESPNEHLITLCQGCHEFDHDARLDVEKTLLKTLKEKGYSSGFIIDLAAGIYSMDKFHVESVMGSVLNWLLKNDELLKHITDLYFESIKKRSNAEMAVDDMPF